MAISTQDFQHGVDFTGLGTTATASNHNQLVDQGTPTADASVDVGRGLPVTTTDSGVGVPVVPDAATNTKWQRYIWIRRPNAADTVTVSKLYTWNNALVSDATYKKWTAVTVDLTAVNAAIATANTNASTALAAANTAQSTANAASTAATAASAAATAANNAAAAAQTTANSASSTATTANANASAALTAANSATTAANANIGAARLVGYSSAFQQIRANSAGTLAEWFDPRNEQVYITNATTQTIATTITWPNAVVRTDTYVIPILTVNSPGALCAITPITYVMTFSPGVYRSLIFFYLDDSLSAATGAGNTYATWYVALQKVSDSSIVLQTPTYSNQPTFTKYIQMAGLLSISNAASSTAYRFIFVGVTTGSGTGVGSTGSISAEPVIASFERFAYIP